MSFTVTVSLSPLCRQSRKLTQLLYHAYLPILFTTWNTLLPELYFRISRKISFTFWKKMKYSLKHRSQRQKYMMMVCIMSQKIMKVDLKLKKKQYGIRNCFWFFCFQVLCAMRFLFDDKFFWQSSVTWTSSFCIIYWSHDGCFNSIL